MSLFLGADETMAGRHRRHRPRVRGPDLPELAPLDAPPRGSARVPGGGDPRRDHAQAVPVRGDRRHRRGDDDQPARGAEQRPQLGLPLLLAARRVLRGARAQRAVRGRHDGEVPRLAHQRAARRRRGPRAAAVRHRAGARAHRVHRAAPPGYRGMGPVRVGNQAHEHFQHDTYGNIILAAAQSFHDHRLFRRGDAADFARSRPWASRPGGCTTSPTPASGSCAPARASTRRRR